MSDINIEIPAHHPIAGLFPMMEGEGFDRLVDDIRTRGLLEPIWLDVHGRILDGRTANVPAELPAYRSRPANTRATTRWASSSA